MPDLTSLEKRITDIFHNQLHLVVPSVDTDLFTTGGLDSLSFVELLVQIEKEFGMKISLEALELDKFRSIANIAEFIARGGQTGGKTASTTLTPTAHTSKAGHG